MTLYEISQYFLFMIFCSFGGWLIEVVGELIKSKKFVNRGFLICPICPIYGVGSGAIALLLSKYENDLFVVFTVSMVLCGTIEYMTSLMLEKIFNSRWWDYSDSRFNINGRICLGNLILFGLAGVMIVKFLAPGFMSAISRFPENVICTVAIIMFVILVIDAILSLIIVRQIKKIKENVQKTTKDNTEETSKLVRQIILEKSLPYRRVIAAFPHVFSEKVKTGKEIIHKTAEKIITNVNETKDKVAEKVSDVKDSTIEKVTTMKNKTINQINLINRKRRILKRISGVRLVRIEKGEKKK